MFMVLFDVAPHQAQLKDYLGFAKLLRPELEQIRGFIDNERFTNSQHPERILSLSTWQDEKALIRWRTHAQHHHVQEQGRGWVFADYQLRIGEITADSGLPGDHPLPQQRFDVTETSEVTSISLIEIDPSVLASSVDQVTRAATIDPAHAPAGWIEAAQYTSITHAGKRIMLSGWATAAAAQAWHDAQIAPVASPHVRSRMVRVIRSYGMRDRSEAPQYYPNVATTAAIW